MFNLSKKMLLSLAPNHYDINFVAAFSVVFIFLVSKAWRRVTSGKNDIPGRLGLPYLGETISFLSATNSTKGCYDFVRLRRLWYGKWFKTRMFGKIHVFVPNPEGARMVFANDFVHFNKGYVKSMADAVGEKSLLCVPHESHKRIRRLLSDPFSTNSLSKFVKKFDKMLCERLKNLEEGGKSFVVLEFSMKLTFDAMCNMLMSITEESLLRDIERDCTSVSDAMLSIPFMIPGTRYYKGIKARERLTETFREMISRRRSGKESPEDFLQSMLQRDSYPSSEKLDDSEIMDNLLTLIVAGQTTTAAAMMWSVKFLDENREAQDKLREEQLSITRSKPEGASLALEDLNNMSYGSKVVKETLRMSNVLLWFPRVALNDCKIEGFEIKKGWHVNIDATCIHYDPDLYKDPRQFDPSRFDEMQKPYSFIPFGSGPRTCLGMNMAKVTMLVFLHRLTSGYKWTVDDLDVCLEKKAHIPRLRSGCPITLKPI
ncbi:abscisic acid 8'-hydroxylase 1-like isoform X1 [Castanea sativa]|uniref:abscisic acid 8'-hydroxylase 1-like isoform X1 n=1 Tax=Castanea sativa TaxID=21020 RepID=UPI003F64C440